MSGLPAPLNHDATIGILGGGQLGRMLAMAAAKLGLKCHVLSPDAHSPAFDVVRRITVADYHDEDALDRFAREVDVVTYEFENVPAATAAFLAARVPVLPDAHALAVTQDRLREKQFLQELGIPTAPFVGVESADEIEAALDRVGRPAVLKTRRFGYDGKGQAMLREGISAADAWDRVGARASIVEAFVPFAREVSVVAARGADGTLACFELTENEHHDHILKISRVPANALPSIADEARGIAERIATALDYVGVLAVEMFVVEADGGASLLVNELAPRVHNSGHWTLDGCSVSQFEQHIRAIAGWPLGTPRRYAPVEMINLIGEEGNEHLRWLGTPGASLHLYGKAAARPGRKMGHVTRVLAGSASETAPGTGGGKGRT